MRLKKSFAIAVLAAGTLGQSVLANATPCGVAAGPVVGGIGLANLLGQWAPAGYSPCPPLSAYDFNKDCKVDGIDLAVYLGAWGTSCGPVSTQIAGNSLTQYPFFEYIRAINQGSTVQGAIDPGRFPSIVGQTCRVYVVNHGVTVGSPLVDVTTGGFQMQTFTAGTIQANTFLISGGTALNGTTGAQVGIGYDMVCDCNQNGVLDGSDYIDGLGSEAGFYVVRDVAAAGPMTPVTALPYAVTGVVAGFTAEQTFYPSNIASLGQLPLVICSHGNGHNYLWYNHIGTHMASYGYIVMSHQNNTGPGPQTAAVTTIQHTNAIIGQQATILSGVLNGHIDTNNIVWIGHSRGGEGVTIAYDHIFDGSALSGGPYPPVGWTLASLKVISSMGPIDFQGPATSNPHGKAYHLMVAQGDADVSGCAGSGDQVLSFHLHDRATGIRQATSIYGAGHGDMHASATASSVFSGPCGIGRAACNQIQRGYFLPLIERYVHNDIPSKDFLWRQYEHFRPISAPVGAACAPPSGTGDSIVVNLMYRDDPATAGFIIDDYLTNPATGTSSSGGAVTFNTSNVFEGQNRDTDASFTWTGGDQMNGVTLARTTDVSNGVVFDWTGPSFYEFAIPAVHQNWTNDVYLSFRAAQGTRHPNTIAALEDLTFDVVLRDGAGNTSSMNIGAYGGGVEEPYQRTSCGTGTGWDTDFETIRLRLSDFRNNGSPINLGNIVAVRFSFGGAGASAVGRLALNEVYLTND